MLIFPNFSCAMLLWTLNKRWQLLPLHPPSRRAMNCPMVRLSPSVTRGSGAQRPSSNPHSWEWNHAVSMKPLTTPSWNAMLTSGRTCTPTPFCPAEPPCTPELLTACKRKSLLWLHLPWKLRLLLLQKGNTLSGSEVPSWLRYPPSNRCGFPNRNMTSPVLLLFTGSASKNVATPPPFFDSCVFKKRNISFQLLAFLDKLPTIPVKWVYFFLNQNFPLPAPVEWMKNWRHYYYYLASQLEIFRWTYQKFWMQLFMFINKKFLFLKRNRQASHFLSWLLLSNRKE